MLASTTERKAIQCVDALITTDNSASVLLQKNTLKEWCVATDEFQRSDGEAVCYTSD
jgi:hypothetical protein